MGDRIETRVAAYLIATPEWSQNPLLPCRIVIWMKKVANGRRPLVLRSTHRHRVI